MPPNLNPPPPNSARCIAPRDIPQAGYVSTPHAFKVIPLMFEHKFKPLRTIMGSFRGSWVKSRLWKISPNFVHYILGPFCYYFPVMGAFFSMCGPFSVVMGGGWALLGLPLPGTKMSVGAYEQARQTRQNSGGVAER